MPRKAWCNGHYLSPRDSHFVLRRIVKLLAGYVTRGSRRTIRTPTAIFALNAQGLRSGTSPPDAHRKQNPRDLAGVLLSDQ